MGKRGWRRREVIARTNAVRRHHGLPPLRHSRRLSAAARFHAHDMARRHYFAHDTAGIAGRIQPISWVTRLLQFVRRPGGENIAYGQHDPAEVMTAWMHSPEHRANILRPGFRTVGVGYDRRGRHWVCDFGY